MGLELEGRIARLEAGATALDSRVTRVENAVQKVNDDQQDFYKHAWPPVQTALQTIAQLNGELVGLRADRHANNRSERRAARAEVCLDGDRRIGCCFSLSSDCAQTLEVVCQTLIWW